MPTVFGGDMKATVADIHEGRITYYLPTIHLQTGIYHNAMQTVHILIRLERNRTNQAPNWLGNWSRKPDGMD